MRAVLLLSAVLAAAATAVATPGAGSMHLPSLLPKEATEVKTTLPDGRVHIKYEAETLFQPKEGQSHTVVDMRTEDSDFAKRGEIALHQNAAEMAASGKAPHTAPAKLHLKYEAVMKPTWKFFELTGHSALGAGDSEALVCIDHVSYYPQGARVAIKRPSAALLAAVTAAAGSEAALKDIVVTAAPEVHTCHGEVFMRRLLAASYDAATQTLHATTIHARHADVFDDLDLTMTAARLTVTHEERDEHLAAGSEYFPHVNDDAAAATGTPYPRPHEARKEVEQVPDTSALPAGMFTPVRAKGQKKPQGWWVKTADDASDDTADDVVLTGDAKATARRFKKQGFFKKVKKAVKKVVKKVSKTVKKVASTIKSAASNVVSYAARAARAVVNAIIPRINVDQNRVVRVAKDFGNERTYTKIKSLYYRYYVHWEIGARFILKITDNRLEIAQASAFGGIRANFVANFSGAVSRSDTADKTLVTGTLPTITFSIGPVPVVITQKIPIVAGYDYDFNDSSYATGALSMYGYVEVGFQYTRANGFRLISQREFTKSSKLDYALQMRFTGSAFIQVMYSGALYAMIVGSGIAQFDIQVNLDSAHPRCGVQATLSCGLEFLVGLDIEVRILGFTIYERRWPRSRLFNQRWSLMNFCQQVRGISGSYSSGSRNFAALALPSGEAAVRGFNTQDIPTVPASQTDNTNFVDSGSSGMVWTATQSCGSGIEYNFALTGFFADGDNDDNATDAPSAAPVATGGSVPAYLNGTTLMYVTITRNVTNFALPANDTARFRYATQRAFTGFEGMPRPGLVVTAEHVDENVFQQCGVNVSADAFTTDDNSSSTLAFPTNVTVINLVFGATISDLTVSVPGFCAVAPMPSRSQTVSPTVPQTAAGLNDLLSIQFDPPKPYAYTIRIGLALCLTFGILAMLLLLRQHKQTAERFQSQADPRGWQFTAFVAVFVPSLILVTALGLAGWSFNYAVIDGMWANENASTDMAPDAYQYREWTFKWWTITVKSCPQPDFCIPNCRANCSVEEYHYKTAPWPYCPDCSATYPWTVAMWSVMAFVCVVACLIALVVLKRHVNRAVVCTFFSYMFALMVYLTRQRIMINIRDAYLNYFAPANEMVVAYELELNATADKCWKAMVAFSFILPAVSTIILIVSFVQREQDAKLRDVHRKEEIGEAVDGLMEETGGSPKGAYRAKPAEDVDKKLDEAAKGGML